MTTQYKQYIYKNGEWKLLGGGDNTDTHHQAKLITANAADSTTQTSQVLSNGNVYLNIVENNAVRSSHKISGSGTSSVTTDANGNILIGSSGGAVTSITAGTGLSGGTITNNGTISANLNSSTSLGTLGTTNKLYAVGVDSNGKLSVNVPWTDTHNTTYLYVGDTGATTNATSAQANPYLALVDGSSNTSNVRLYAGSNMSISAINGVVTFTSTWKANDSTNEGYVAATGGSTNAGKVWKVNSNGTPGWLEDTDTHHQAKLITTNSASSTTQTSSALSNGDVYLNIVENGSVRSSHKISGSGTSSVTTDASGNILIGSSGGAVTSITAGTGLSGGTITNNGTISANLNSTTSLGTLGTTSKLYAIGVDSNGKLSVNIPWTDTTYTFAEGSVDGAFSVNNTSVSIHGLGDRAFDSTTYIPTSSRAAANGVAPLNASSKIDATYLPSYVDDVLEYSAQSSFPTTGTSGIIYVDTSDGKIYRWSGSQYINISADTNTTYTFASGSTSGTFTVTASNNPSNPQTITVGDTWIANDATHSGYVAATGGSTNAGKVWKVGNTGTPGWFNDTDTHYEAKLITADSASSTTQTTSTLSNGNVYLNLIENGTKRSGHKISGSGDTTVTTDASGNIIISSTSGTNTAITVGTGLSTNVSGGIITGAGTISANLNSTTSLGTLGTTDKLYAVGVDANGKLSVNVPWSNTHNTTYLYAGDTGATANATSAQANPYLALVDGGSNTSNIQLYGGANVSISAVNGVVTFSSTWQANDATHDGYVAAPGGSTNKGKVWKVGDTGTPTWLEESTSIYVRANPSYTTDITGTAATDPYLVLNNTISNTSSVQIASGNNVTVSGLGDIITINSLDEKVTQTASNTNATYEVLFSGSANNNTATEGVKKYSNLTFNPSTGMFTTSKATITNLSLSGTGTSVSMASGGTVTGFPTMTVLTGASVPASGQNPDHVATITYSAGVLSFTSKKFTTGQALYNNGVVI